jgi:chemotaxis protein methyltransferase CheR
MNVDDFNLLAKLIKEKSGLTLTQEKAYLLESRLLPVARTYSLKNLDELVMRIRTRQEQNLVRDVVEAMTTNESFFFRDIKPFDQFKQVVLPYLLQARAATRTIKIWSAACSSGQEPYTLAMVLKEERQKLIGWNIDIVATDLSTEILAKAQAGLYSQFEVQRGLPIQMLVKYFKQVGDRWQIDPSLREMVRYRPFNLLDDMNSLGSFDVIFCRNVLIYFDQPTKQLVLERMARHLGQDGFLYLGGAETVVGITDKFQPMTNHRGMYHLANSSATARVAAL